MTLRGTRALTTTCALNTVSLPSGMEPKNWLVIATWSTYFIVVGLR